MVRLVGPLFDGPVPFLGTKAFSAKEMELCLLSPPIFRGKPLIIVGLGDKSSVSPERLRRATAVATKEASRLNFESLTLFAPELDTFKSNAMAFEYPIWESVGSALADGALLSLYSYDKYRSTAEPPALRTVTILAHPDVVLADLRKGVSSSKTTCEGTWFARDLANAPGNEIFPDSLADAARSCGKTHGFKVKVYDENEIQRLGMGGLHGVGQGSARPPRFIILEHGQASKRGGPVVLVGKGVTFDAGGISIKPSTNMAEMKMDMSGAAAVLGVFQATAAMGLSVHMVGLIPAAENLPGGRALKPGDILRHVNGMTSEIDNTDAEGRLILADALAYSARFKPSAVIDLATLTGAVVVALGHVATGMFGTDAGLLNQLKISGERTYERVWELPMFEEYEKLIKSDIADVKNVGGRWAGAITAALFLKRFIGTSPWVHLDIAGTAIMEEAQEYIPKGASGVGVRLLTDFLRHRRSA